MPRKIECSSCRKRYLIDDAIVGKQFRCKVCGAVFTVPELPEDILDLLRDDDDEPKTSRPAEPARKKKKKKS